MIENLGNRLKYVRISLKLSQKKFATFLNIPLRTYQDYERGVTCPGPEIIVNIANKLGVSIDWLFGRELKYIYGTDADIIQLIKLNFE
ncbi:helix-turn-helix domain-containing protein [Tepidibacter hydrothermalis]|uniref:Helix-turn-helix transcriptional regulator n=1 Tax=Tepidibacter hydrothermalis TaxID=3036126 RepID=A0ABY8EG96_9FIRM|nr:helix-turn-helix transcriptional regulator [Tepidibacter hydrothermalis]WFD11977.1 helix-turn-helix transcriptional regulator [Tepidibacter hydrothermalis]